MALKKEDLPYTLTQSILESVRSGNCPYVFRVVDGSQYERKGELFAGTAVLVSDQGQSEGYALTCWHNFDPDFRVKPFLEERGIPDFWLLPRWVLLDVLTWRRPEVVVWRRPAVIVGKWSNPINDFAVLKVAREVIQAFQLKPAPITFDLYSRQLLLVVGLHRPGVLAEPDHIQVHIVPDGALFKKLQEGTEVFEVERTEGRILWDTGMSGGAIFSSTTGALVGLPVAVDPDEETRSHRYRGYGVAMKAVAETWTTICDYCWKVPSDPKLDKLAQDLVAGDDQRRLAAAQLLAQIGPHSLFVGLLIERSAWTTELNPVVRHWINQALGRVGSTEAVEALERNRSDPDPFAALGAEDSLERIKKVKPGIAVRPPDVSGQNRER